MWVLLFNLVFSCSLNAQGTTPSANGAAASKPTHKLFEKIHGYVEQAQKNELYKDSEWLLLGHYIDDYEYGYYGEVDGETFYLHPEGKMNPDLELQASIEKIFDNSKVVNDKHPRCIFPSRYEYLSRKLNIPFDSIPETLCDGFTKFKNRLQTDSISFIFSSYFINNPSSTFGHTLLRMNKKRDPMTPSTELLDAGINYAANPWTENPIFYALGGIIGSFPGTFSQMPYYIKVREYNDHESRDLWSYKLDFTEPEIRQLERHIWDLGATYFKYYFFSENCSYHILRALEASAPRWKFTKGLSHWVIPSDTVLHAHKIPGLITETHFRPSNLRVFLERYKNLSEEEKVIFNQKRLQGFSADFNFENSDENKNAKILDTLIDYYEFKNAKKLQDQKSQESKFKQKMLSVRAKNPVITKELQVTEPEQKPHTAHPSMRLGIQTGYDERLTDFQTLHVRFALHDYMDPDYGYPENAQIEFLNIKIKSFNELQNHKIDQVALMSIKSYSPYTFYAPDMSWQVEFGAKTFYDKQCRLCSGIYFQNALGYSYDLTKNKPLTVFAFLNYEVNYSDSFKEDNFRIVAGPQVGFLWKIQRNFKLFSDATLYYDPVEDYHFFETQIKSQYAFSKQFSVQVGGLNRTNDLEGSLTLFYYH